MMRMSPPRSALPVGIDEPPAPLEGGIVRRAASRDAVPTQGRLVLSCALTVETETPVVRVSVPLCEAEGPRTPDLSHKGFGLKLIDREVAFNLGGGFSVDIAPDGLTATIAFPLE
jgi:hypothetical protein